MGVLVNDYDESDTRKALEVAADAEAIAVIRTLRSNGVLFNVEWKQKDIGFYVYGEENAAQAKSVLPEFIGTCEYSRLYVCRTCAKRGGEHLHVVETPRAYNPQNNERTDETITREDGEILALPSEHAQPCHHCATILHDYKHVPYFWGYRFCDDDCKAQWKASVKQNETQNI